MQEIVRNDVVMPCFFVILWVRDATQKLHSLLKINNLLNILPILSTSQAGTDTNI